MSIAIEPAFAMGLFENIEAYPVVYYSTRSNIYPSLVFIKILLILNSNRNQTIFAAGIVPCFVALTISKQLMV